MSNSMNPQDSQDSTVVCGIEDCQSKKEVKGMCDKHYRRLFLYGRTYKIKGQKLAHLKELLELQTDECILWPYARTRDNYGRIRIEGKDYLVHRLASKKWHGEPPKGKTNALHKPLICHNPSCLNYRHLYWGNNRDNMADKRLDGTHMIGELSNTAKLTESQVLSIYNDNRPNKIIALEYGVGSGTIGAIKRGKSWSWLTLGIALTTTTNGKDVN